LSEVGSITAAKGDADGVLRPIEGEALRQATRLSRRAFAALDARSWTGFVDSLLASNNHPIALTHALVWGLPSPLLIRWACLSARLEEVASDRSDRSKALVAAELWLRKGEEKDRYEGYDRGSEEGFETPGALAALAAFLSGPSLAPQGARPEAPPPKLGRACAANVLAVAATSEPLGKKGFQHINVIGLDLAFGGDGRTGAHRALAAIQGDPARGS
jgi:hypothetical protein